MCSKGWSYRCAIAKGSQCTCKCRGLCHGKARGQNKEQVLVLRQQGQLPNSTQHGYVQQELFVQEEAYVLP